MVHQHKYSTNVWQLKETYRGPFYIVMRQQHLADHRAQQPIIMLEAIKVLCVMSLQQPYKHSNWIFHLKSNNRYSIQNSEPTNYPSKCLNILHQLQTIYSDARSVWWIEPIESNIWIKHVKRSNEYFERKIFDYDHSYLWWIEWIGFWHFDFQLEFTTFVRCVGWSSYFTT